MSKILISCATLSCGGAERVLSILSPVLADNYDEVIYLMWLRSEIYYNIDPRVKLIYLPDLSGYNNRYQELFCFRRYVKQENPDLILSFLTPFNMLVLVSTIGLKFKIVVCERNDPHYVPGGKFTEMVRDILYYRAYGILAQTEYSKNCFRRKLKDKTSVIFNPIAMSPILVGSGIQEEKENYIVNVGRLHPQKNQRMLIDAFALFLQKHPNYELIIYGEGALKKYLCRYVKSISLNGKIHFPGKSPNVWDRLKHSKIFVLSSKAEGMSNALIEAMCLGIPVISTKVAGACDLIEDGKNGFLIEQNDVTTMCQRMCQLVEDEKLAQSIGEKGSQIYKKLNSETICAQWLSFINKCLYKSHFE